MKKRAFLFLLLACIQCGRGREPGKRSGEAPPPVPEKKPAHNSIEVLGVNEGLLSNNIIKILLYQDDILCLSETGLVRISRKTGRVLNHPEDGRHFTSFDLFQETVFLTGEKGIFSFSGEKTGLLFQADSIIPELIQSSEQLLCMTRDGSLYQMDREQSTFSLARRITNASFSLARSMEGAVLLSDQRGLYQYDIRQDRLTNLTRLDQEGIADFTLDREAVYFGNKGVYRMDRKTGEVKKLLSLPPDRTVGCLFRDENNLYIGKDAGITRLDLPTGSCLEILDPYFVHDARVNHMVRDGHILLVATANHGLVKYIMNPPSL